MNRSLVIPFASLVISLVVLAMKVEAYRLTGSVALYSDALETVINVAAAGAALLALWYSALPADANHPYGHYKAEYFSSIVEGALVLATAFMIANAAWQGWQHPVQPSTPLRGIMVNGAAGVINLVWALLLLRVGRRRKSPALVAGGRHLMTDVWTTCAVLAGFALVPLTGWLRLDSLIAGIVALNILWTGYGVLRRSVGGLMDEVSDLAEVTKVREAIEHAGQGAMEAHDVRMRIAGRMTFVDFHLVVPGERTVNEAHAICDRIERSIRAVVGEAVISIHVEPAHKAKQHGQRELDIVILS